MQRLNHHPDFLKSGWCRRASFVLEKPCAGRRAEQNRFSAENHACFAKIMRASFYLRASIIVNATFAGTDS